MTADTVLPQPRLQHTRNATPFPHLQFDKMGKGRRFFDVVIVCGSFALGNGRLQRAQSSRGPILADEMWNADNPALSSLRNAGDLVLRKPGADIYVTGTARSLDCARRPQWHALLRLQREERPLINKMLCFTGPRWWKPGLLGYALTRPEPTDAVPLRYELAYGGWWYDQGMSADAEPQVVEENPAGSGWFGSARRPKDARGRYVAGELVTAPQIEYADAPIRAANRRHRVAGFGPIARHWMPRYGWAGSYDAAWLAQFQREVLPDYPADFDERFFHCAPADQIVAAGLIGDEDLQLAGLFAEVPAVAARLPHLWIEAVCHPYQGAARREALRLDTVHVDLDQHQVHLTWRLTLDQTDDIVHVELFDRLIANGRLTRTAYRGIHR